MPRAVKVKEPIPLLIPKPDARIKRWIVVGLDPSMSRTGFTLLDVRPALAHTPEEGPYTDAVWLTAGSIKPEFQEADLHPRNTIWIRGKAIATYLREMIKTVAPAPKVRGDLEGYGDFDPAPAKSDVGLIISMEFPTPRNDYLVALNRIISQIFFEDGELTQLFGDIRFLITNASTLRSLMGLTQKGSKNKAENILKAYEFIDHSRYPQLDSDACDAVLLAMMARHAASVMMGITSEVPERFLMSLCSGEQKVKGNGRNAHTVTAGLLHRIEYWYRYQRRAVGVAIKDASNPKKSLSRVNFSI